MLSNWLANLFQFKKKYTTPKLKKTSFILEINNLNVINNKKDKFLLKEINIKVPEYSIMSIIGPSGSGKSSLIKSINRISFEDKYKREGEIKYCGVNILKKFPEDYLRTQIGTVLQRPIMFPMSIRDNILLAPKQSGIRNPKDLEKILENSLKQANLWEEVKDRLNSNPEDILSIGQQQRLCIARAIAMQPRVLLMDEPTSALDIKSAKKIEELIKNISRNKIATIMIISHSLQQVKRISDYTVFIKNGMIIEQGRTKEIFENPKHEETKKFINNVA